MTYAAYILGSLAMLASILLGLRTYSLQAKVRQDLRDLKARKYRDAAIQHEEIERMILGISMNDGFVSDDNNFFSREVNRVPREGGDTRNVLNKSDIHNSLVH